MSKRSKSIHNKIIDKMLQPDFVRQNMYIDKAKFMYTGQKCEER